MRQLRRVRGWSQEHLAELAGNTYKHIGQIERGEVNVTLDILTAIADGFAVNVAELFGPAGDAPARGYTLSESELDTLEQALRILERARPGRGKRRSAD